MYYIGVDISKEKLDLALMDATGKVKLHRVVKNDESRIISCLRAILRKYKITPQDILTCCEETGIYKMPLVNSCLQLCFPLWVESAFKIKKASSSLRGKNDKMDAVRIADYAKRYEDKKRIFQSPDKRTKAIQVLLNARETIITDISGYKQQLSESKRFDPEKYALQKGIFDPIIKALRKKKLEIDQQMDELIKQEPQMQTNAELLMSIPGIGKQNALQFIVYTNNFKSFENAKHLACYAGVAPFPNESGAIIKKARVSSFANKKLKKLLHMASMACVKAPGELKAYFIRKVQEGKNKMLVLNNIRNKLIERMFAVIKRQAPYFSNKLEKTLAF